MQVQIMHRIPEGENEDRMKNRMTRMQRRENGVFPESEDEMLEG